MLVSMFYLGCGEAWTVKTKGNISFTSGTVVNKARSPNDAFALD